MSILKNHSGWKTMAFPFEVFPRSLTAKTSAKMMGWETSCEFPFGAKGLCSGAFAVKLRECTRMSMELSNYLVSWVG